MLILMWNKEVRKWGLDKKDVESRSGEFFVIVV